MKKFKRVEYKELYSKIYKSSFSIDKNASYYLHIHSRFILCVIKIRKKYLLYKIGFNRDLNLQKEEFVLNNLKKILNKD